MSKTEVYLDHAAATPLDQRVFEVMQESMLDQFYNPAAAYAPARAVRIALNESRHRLAMVLGAKEAEIVLTAGATESINIAIYGVMSGQAGNIIVGATEHAAVRAAAGQFDVRVAEVDGTGMVKLDQLENLINDQTRLISLCLADSELGTVQPIKQVAEIIDRVRADRTSRRVKTSLYLHSDGSQAAGLLDLNVARFGVDLLSLNAAKCYGPKQTGLLFIKTGLELTPLIRGGGQECGLRSGTESLANAVGFAESLELAEKRRHQTVKELAGLRKFLADELLTRIDGLQVNGHPKKHLPGLLHVSLAGLDAERVVFALDNLNIMVATGAACAANKGTGSSVLRAIKLAETEANGSLRLSLGRTNSQSQIQAVAPLITDVIKREKQLC